MLLLLMPGLSWPHGDELEFSEQVEIMYVAYYGRPGDPAGVDYWAGRLEDEGGGLEAIIDDFGNSQEYLDRYAGQDSATLVNNIYVQLLARDADVAGRDFYVGKLEAGELSLASIALDIYNGVTGADVLTVENKTGIAHDYTDLVRDTGAEYGSEQIEQARALIDSVDDTVASVDVARASLTEIFDQEPLLNCENLEGSFERIQTVVFEGYGCSNSACHGGASPEGNLDLRAGVAYANLIRVPASANLSEPLQLVYPGEQSLSFLYQKMAAATEGTPLPSGGGQPMPIGLAPLTEDHLEAVRLWIRGGAPEFRDVDGVAELLGCDQGTEPTANKIDPPPPPDAAVGTRFHSGPWTVEPNSEGEVCYATYYDLEKQAGGIPAWAKADCAGGALDDYEGECFAYNRRTLTQDPQSHHSIIDVYHGAAGPADPAWGEWTCLDGPHAGMSCDPEQIGISVLDGGADCGGPLTACGTRPVPSIACTGFGPNDLRQSTTGAGGAQSPISTSNLQEGVYSVLPVRGFMIWNSHAFNLTREATSVEQYNDFWYAPVEERVYRSRGIFDARNIFVANVPPYEQRTYCSHYTLPRYARLTSLSSHAHKRGVLWQTWLPPQDPGCTVRDPACTPNDTPAEYVSRIYNDPLSLDFDPPLAFDEASVSSRTLKYCVTYDNGAEFPDLLKRDSTSVGTRCPSSAYCVGGEAPGRYCGADDSVCGAGGVCDACVVRGGFTTEDEMFILLGGFYVKPPN
jgi:hypothetical protein